MVITLGGSKMGWVTVGVDQQKGGVTKGVGSQRGGVTKEGGVTEVVKTKS